MSFKTSNYGAARGILGLFEILLWCGLAVGILIAISAGGAASRGFGASGLVAAIPGIFITITCFIGIVLVQMAKAGVDSADYSYQMLEIARKQLTISEQTLRQGKEMAQSFAERIPADRKEPAPPAANQRVSYGTPTVPDSEKMQHPSMSEETSFWDYKGARINRSDFGFLVDGKNFVSLEEARAHVDQESAKHLEKAKVEAGP